jgi:hypothetical protein
VTWLERSGWVAVGLAVLAFLAWRFLREPVKVYLRNARRRPVHVYRP